MLILVGKELNGRRKEAALAAWAKPIHM